MGFFEAVKSLPPDPIFGLEEAFKLDPRPDKVNLGAGIYKTADLAPLTLTSVKRAQQMIMQQGWPSQYLPIGGFPPFIAAAQELVFGESYNDRIFACQTVGGTGALRVAGEFISDFIGKEIHVPDPTWDNHKRVLTMSGLNVEYYPYYDRRRQDFSWERMRNYLSELPERSVILLHGCCHNPTGADPTCDEWREMVAFIKERKLFPLVDLAYQGFAEGLQEDAYPVRLMAREGLEFAVAYSFSKNMGLYSERVGVLFLAAADRVISERVASRLKVLIRGNYSNPPSFGARIAATILSDTELRQKWEQEVFMMRERIHGMRGALVSALLAEQGGRDFSFLNKQKGMFSFCGLEQDEVGRLISDFGIYMPSNGRINIAGLNSENIRYVIDAILAVSS